MLASLVGSTDSVASSSSLKHAQIRGRSHANPMQGAMLDMMRDVNTGIRWILNHTQFHGGDSEQVYLVGQSCGAQLAAMSLITQVTSRLLKHALRVLHPALFWHTSCPRCMLCLPAHLILASPFPHS